VALACCRSVIAAPNLQGLQTLDGSYDRDLEAAAQGELFLIRVGIPYESQNRLGVYLSGFAQCENFIRGSRQDLSENLNNPLYRARLID
jgi:hypothetical protein